MRGGDGQTGELFSYVDLEARVRRDHPLRRIRAIVNEALSALEREFAALYSPIGRPSIPPEKLLRAMLLQAFYSIRSERLLMERLEYDLLFRWFVGIGVDDAAWDHSVFSKNRDRLLEGDIAAKFLAAVLAQPKVKKLLSTDHFSVDGTLIEAWASMKCRIASRKMLPRGFVASPKMLPVKAHVAMVPSPPGRQHEDEDDTCHAYGTGQCSQGSLCGRDDQGQAPDLGGVHCGDGVSRKVRNPCPEQPPGAEAPSDPPTPVAL
ncbi:hypothetical protein MesoLjLc_68630 [Mesorhizobium sp. L-8-10]|nr:hypothetical protein MesoLjLc_68630 [Mesorhizobium sp. L-8-10]